MHDDQPLDNEAIFDETARNFIQDAWLDHYNSLAEYQTAWIKRETLTLQRVEALSAKVLEQSGHVYELMTRMIVIEKAVLSLQEVIMGMQEFMQRWDARPPSQSSH
jgi:hypothetical protein